MWPISTAVSMRSGAPQFGQDSPAVTARRSTYLWDGNPSRREILYVIVLFVRARNQIGAAFESFVNEQNGASYHRRDFRPLNP
jgi:hypothetical protein